MTSSNMSKSTQKCQKMRNGWVMDVWAASLAEGAHWRPTVHAFAMC